LFGLLLEFRGHSALSAAASLVFVCFEKEAYIFVVLILSFSRTLPNCYKRCNQQLREGVTL